MSTYWSNALGQRVTVPERSTQEIAHDDPCDLCDEVAEMIADWFGRSVIPQDRDLAHQIITHVLDEA